MVDLKREASDLASLVAVTLFTGSLLFIIAMMVF